MAKLRPGENLIQFCARQAVEEKPAETARLLVHLLQREAELLAENAGLRRRLGLPAAEIKEFSR